MTLRLGLIGRGHWGQNIEHTLALFPGVSVVSVTRNGQLDKALDGVLIATPSATHAEIALPYIEAGIPTFIEKPMATSMAHAERIRDATARSGTPVFIGHIYLYHPAFLVVDNLLPTLGKVQSIICEGANGRPRADSSVVWDWLPHDLSIAREVFRRDAEEVQAWKLLGGVCAEVAVSRFLFGDASVVSTMSWHAPAPIRRITFVFESSAIVFDDKASSKLMVYYGSGEILTPVVSKQLPLAREMEAFLAMVKSKKTDVSHIEAGIATVRMIAAAERSMELNGKPVEVGSLR